MNAAEQVKVLAIMPLSQAQKVGRLQKFPTQSRNWAIMSKTREKMNDLGNGGWGGWRSHMLGELT